MRIVASIVCVLFLSLGAVGAQDAHSHAASKPVTVDIKNAEGHSVGTAVLTTAQHGVKIKSAGPHFGGAHPDHSSGLPLGDIPDFSLIVAADGTAHASVVAPNVTLGSDDHSVFSNGGTAIVIHAVSGGASSGAPPRIACGVITKPE
jgi:Cu/Zn superoxide dismutase